MAVCNPQTLLDANPCLSALNPHTLKTVKVQMLCNLYNNLDSGAELSCDIATLLADAACFNALSDFQLDVIEAQLLCEIFALL